MLQILRPRMRWAAAPPAASPTSARRPCTYISPSLIAPSGSIRHSQSDVCTSIDMNRTPRRCASFTSVAG